MQTIFITGTSGFIGRNLSENLKNNYILLTPTHKELDLLSYDEVKKFFENERIDIVIHTANTNPVMHQEYGAYEQLNNNLRMFFNLERCKNLYDRMYYFGSGAEYDMEHYIPKMKEEYFDTYVPKDDYGYSKYIMAKIALENKNIYNLRLFGVYGKYEEWNRRFISDAIYRSLHNQAITINQNVYFDYLYIDDLVDIMRWFIENVPKYKTYNICSGMTIDLLSLANIVKQETGNPLAIEVFKEGWKSEYSGDNTRLILEIGTKQFTSYRDAIVKMIDFYSDEIKNK